MSDGDNDTSGPCKVSLSFGIKKKSKKPAAAAAEHDGRIAAVFYDPLSASVTPQQSFTPEAPLIIPVVANKFSVKNALKKAADSAQTVASASSLAAESSDLPDAPDFESETFERVTVTVHTFGAAMLLGMENGMLF